MTRPVESLDRTDCRILKRLNTGREMPEPGIGNRVEKLIEAGFVEEGSFGEVAITLRGQLELARWRFRGLPKSRYAISGPTPRNSLFRKFFKTT